MLVGLYTVLFLVALFLTFYSIQHAQEGKRLEAQSQGNNYMSAMLMLAISAVLFATTAYAAFDLEQHHCDSQVKITNTSSNVTTYTNDIVCEKQSTTDQTMAVVSMMLFFLDLFLLLIYGLRLWR